MNVTVEPAESWAKPTLRNLMQLYFYDMSEFKPREVDGQGLYHYKYFDDYWTEPDRYPFLFRVDRLPVGFALVRFVNDGCADISEFFVIRSKRREGVGSEAARQLFDKFRGRWQVRQEPNNFAAQDFWRSVIHEYMAGDFEELTLDEGDWHGPAQRFDSRRSVETTRGPAEEA